SYNAISRPIKIQTAIGAETYTYLDWQTQIIDPNNHQTDKFTDAFGRLIKVNEHNEQNIYSTQYQYNSQNNLIKIIDAAGNEREFIYDSLGRQIKNELLHKPETTASTYIYQYDKNSNKIKETYPDGRSVNYSYDQLNRILTKDDPQTPETEISYLYDQAQFGLGKLAKTQTAEYNIEYQYDKQGNVKEEDRAIVKPQPKDQFLTGWAWSDKVGWISFNCKDREKETGKVCQNGNDPNFNPDQNLIDYSVQIDGKTGIVSGCGWSEHLGWISFNKIDTGTPPAAPYNEAQIDFIAKADLDSTNPTSDLTGWARALVFGSTAVPSTNSPDFDGWIKLDGAAQDNSTFGVKINKQTKELEGWAYGGACIGWISFNCLNTNACSASDYQVKNEFVESQNIGEPVEFQTYLTKYSFDNFGALQQISYPDNSIVDYDYNQIGKIRQVKKDGQALVANITYGSTEAIKSIVYANGAQSTYAYDQNELYRLKNKTTTQNSNILQNINYAYDPVGNITRIQDLGTQIPKDSNYTYDDLNRLTQANINGLIETYSYSPSGNILSKTNIGNYEYGNSRHPQAVTKAGSDTFEYDGNGNLVSSLRATGEAISYQYNYANRLVEIADPVGTFRYVYGDGYERIQKQLPDGKITTYLGEIAEVNELGELTDYLFVDKLRVATVDKNGLYYRTNDHLSSASILTNTSGQIAQKLDFLPFVAERLNEKAGDFETRFTFTDQEKDAENGLLYYGARYYNAEAGRFTQPDPAIIQLDIKLLNNPQLLNAYTYSLNNPLRYIDPDGKRPDEVITGWAIGFAEGVGNTGIWLDR
ncbi:MAG: hypothetical protein KJ923_05865, partial [Candidatus Omnitrophica bacterium]|nr:hypothetical protein [Candidatus Omnitrophota bacterium]